MSTLDQVRKETRLFEWVRLLFGILAQQGVKHVVLCPGSRNAPLIYGATEQPEFTCHAVIDERAAAFLALGLARASGEPAAVVCTSGTAVAHFFPAVIEAHEASVPLIVISADRPSSLQSSGAAQTISQHGLFGSYAHTLAGWDEPSADPTALRHFASRVTQLVQSSRGPLPGPVHLNLPLAKPLEPLPPTNAQETELHDLVTRLVERRLRLHPPRTLPAIDDLRSCLQTFAGGHAIRLLSLGPVPPQLVAPAQQLAEHLQIPLLTELPGVPSAWGVDTFAAAYLKEPSVEPLHVLHIGPPLVSAFWGEVIQKPAVKTWVWPGVRYLEPSACAEQVLLGDLPELLRQAVLLGLGPLSSAAAPRAGVTLSDALSAVPPAALGCMSEPHAMSAILGVCKRARHLVLGNSLSIRLAAWVQSEAAAAPYAVHCARGTNGIDGLIAQACGVSQATAEATLLILGDVAVAHDLTSLMLARSCTAPFLIVVIDNQGGRIFQHLPGARLWPSRPSAVPFFLTSPEIDWAAVGTAFGVTAEQCRSISELQTALNAALVRGGASLVVAHTDPDTTQAFLHTLHGGLT